MRDANRANNSVSASLLAGAGLFTRTLYNLRRLGLEFNLEKLLVFTLQPEQAHYKDERRRKFFPDQEILGKHVTINYRLVLWQGMKLVLIGLAVVR